MAGIDATDQCDSQRFFGSRILNGQAASLSPLAPDSPVVMQHAGPEDSLANLPEEQKKENV